MNENKMNTILLNADPYNPVGYSNGTCRMNIKNAKQPYYIVIPEHWMSKYNKNRIEDWIKLLNSTLFECELEKVEKVNLEDIGIYTEKDKDFRDKLMRYIKDQLINLEVTLAEPKNPETFLVTKSGYYASDAISAKAGGKIRTVEYSAIDVSKSPAIRHVVIKRNDRGDSWYVSIGDFNIKDTGESLLLHINALISDFKERNYFTEEDTKVNA